MKQKMTIIVSPMDLVKKTRSPFSTSKMTGAGAHKSAKDYDRKTLKHSDKKLFDCYK